jgi:hypothetical protein
MQLLGEAVKQDFEEKVSCMNQVCLFRVTDTIHGLFAFLATRGSEASAGRSKTGAN